MRLLPVVDGSSQDAARPRETGSRLVGDFVCHVNAALILARAELNGSPPLQRLSSLQPTSTAALFFACAGHALLFGYSDLDLLEGVEPFSAIHASFRAASTLQMKAATASHPVSLMLTPFRYLLPSTAGSNRMHQHEKPLRQDQATASSSQFDTS